MSDRMARWVLNRLVAGYPDGIRAEYGREIVETILRRRRGLGDRIGRWGVIRFWGREYLGVVRGARLARAEDGTTLLRWRCWTPERLFHDVRFGFRTMGKNPTLFATAVLVLGIGIGANAALAGLGWAVLFGPLPVAEPERVVRLFHADDLTFGVSINELHYYREDARTLSDIAGWRDNLDATFTPGDGGEPMHVVGARVTPNLLLVLGTTPSVGRTFARDGSRAEVMLTYRFWSERFGRNTEIVGRSAVFNGISREIVGVLPDDFSLFDADHAYVFPIDFTAPRQPGRGGMFLDAVARLAPGTDLRSAETEVTHLATSLRQSDPAAYEAEEGFGAHLVPFRESIVAGHRSLVTVLVLGAVLVLLTTCMNVATLLAAQVEARQNEFAVRRAIGATTVDLYRTGIVEGLLIAGAAAAAGTALASWLTGLLRARMTPELVVGGSSVSVAVTVVVIIATLIAGVTFAATPVKALRRLGGFHSVRTATGRTSRTSLVLRVTQTGIAVVLLSGALLLYASARNLGSVDLGYRTANVVTARVTLPASRYSEPVSTLAFFEQVIDRIASGPSGPEAAAVNALPLSAAGGSGDVYVEAIRPDSAVDVIAHRIVSSGYFRVLGVPLLAGRMFDENDRADRPRVTVVDEAFARQFLGSPERAVGERIRSFFGGPEWNEIVGVVGSVRHTGPRAGAGPHAYYPMAQRPTRGAHVVTRGVGDVPAAIARIRDAVSAVDPALPVYDVATMQGRLRGVTARNRFTLQLFGGFAALALILAVVGVYGTVRLAQQRRAREVGIRHALGATRSHILWIMTRDAAAATGLGAGLGAVGAIVMGTALESLLFGVSSHDPLILLGAGVLIAGAGTLAAWIPARAAIAVDPVEVLRPD